MKTGKTKTLLKGSKVGQVALLTVVLSGVAMFNPVYALFVLAALVAVPLLRRMTDGDRSIMLTRLTTCVLMALVVVPMMADSGGAAALNEVGAEFGDMLEPAKKVCNAIAAIIALIGGLTIMMKLNNGDQDVKKTAMLVIGGCTAFVILGESLPAMFSD